MSGKTYSEMLYASMVYGFNWFELTFVSFVCALGNMTLYISSDIYNGIISGAYSFYGILFIIGLISMLVAFFLKTRKQPKKQIFYICLLIAGIIPILLSMKYSYETDYQAQRKISLSYVGFFDYIYSNRN